jgi:hypothetical protein
MAVDSIIKNPLVFSFFMSGIAALIYDNWPVVEYMPPGTFSTRLLFLYIRSLLK